MYFYKNILTADLKSLNSIMALPPFFDDTNRFSISPYCKKTSSVSAYKCTKKSLLNVRDVCALRKCQVEGISENMPENATANLQIEIWDRTEANYCPNRVKYLSKH